MTVELRRILNEVKTIPPEDLEGLKIALLTAILESNLEIVEKLCQITGDEPETHNEVK